MTTDAIKEPGTAVLQDIIDEPTTVALQDATSADSKEATPALACGQGESAELDIPTPLPSEVVTGMYSERIAQREETLRRTLGPNYTDVKFWRSPGTREIYRATWLGVVPVVAKLDKPNEELDTPRKKRHVEERGCDTGNEFEAMRMMLIASQGRPVENYHLNRIHDFGQMPLGGEDSGKFQKFTVEGFFDGETLEERVARKPFTAAEARRFSQQLMVGSSFLHGSVKVYNRDIKPSNVLVKGEGDSLDMRFTDYANVRPVSDVTAKLLPTVGGHLVMDPLLIGEFTGTERAFNPQSELFSIGATLFYSLTGKYVAEFDPDKGFAVVYGEQDTLLTKDGKIDVAKYETTLQKALSELPREHKQFAPILKRMLTLDEKKRYSSTAEAKKAIDKMCAPTLLDRLTQNRTLVASVAGVVLALAGSFGAIGYNSVSKSHAQQMQANNMVEIETRWNSYGFDMASNLVAIHDVMVMKEGEVYKIPEGFDSSVRENFLKLQPGQKIDITLPVRKVPVEGRRNVRVSDLVGRAYIEGVPGIRVFAVYPQDFDEGANYNEYGPSNETQFEVPKDIAPGNYALVFDVSLGPQSYSDNKPGISYSVSYYEGLRAKEGTLVARKRIPIVVGDVPAGNVVALISDGIINGPKVGFTRDDRLAKQWQRSGLEFEFSILEEGLSTTYTNPHFSHVTSDVRFPFTEGPREVLRTLEVVATSGKDLVGIYYLPVQRHDVYKGEKLDPRIVDNLVGKYISVKMASPTKEWAEKLPAYRIQALQRHKK